MSESRGLITVHPLWSFPEIFIRAVLNYGGLYSLTLFLLEVDGRSAMNIANWQKLRSGARTIDKKGMHACCNETVLMELG